MKNISIIACVGRNLELGKNNQLIWHLPNDLKYFKKLTTGKTVLMGRKTFDSIQKALPNRKNVVLQRKKAHIENVIVVNSFDDALKLIENEDVFIIGGASIYKQFLDYADRLYLTEVEAECDDADVFFPTFDKSLYEKEIIDSEEDNGLKYHFVLYKRNNRI